MVQRPIPAISFKVSALQNQNPLDYYFWNKVKTKEYEVRLNTPFESEEEIISKIKSVWKEWALMK